MTDEAETEYGSMVCEKATRYQSVTVDEKTRERLDRLTFLMILSSVLSYEVILQADDHSVEHTGRLSLMFWETITMWKYRMGKRDHHRGG